MARQRDYSLFARVVFYNADLEMISPVVSHYWERPVAQLLRDSGAMFTTNVPDASCARFIGWYFAQPGVDDFHLGVDNLPVPMWQPSGDDAKPPAGWLDRLLTEVAGWNPPAVLARLDMLEITQGGRLLWRSAHSEDLFAPEVGRRGMSAILRAYGADFAVDTFLVGCTLPVCAVKRRGEPVFPTSQPDGRRHEWSGVHVEVSDADFDEFPQQAAEAAEFLRREFEQVRRLCEWAGVDGVTLDFGVARRDVAVQCDLLPADLVRVAGSLGLSIELSQYPALCEDNDV